MRQTISDEDLFAAALIMPRRERAHLLARACGDDAAALSRLSGLLESFDDAADFVRSAPLTARTSSSEEIRSYRLLRELGEGGCGIAYLAEQLEPVKRQVAVKVIKPGMDTKAVVARFEAERQLLALMDHPNVATVFDAGSTAAGRPYFVMELVRGISITEYCDLLRLSIAERLQLFIQVCQAIQHAHHKGVMHRDIKPSNVLVTMHEGQPLVKVIDFGIAKATQGPLSEQTFHTALEQFIGTPAYISPEQTELAQRNVDTRSDIYSLGVLLYELLTGCTPLDTHELMRSTAEELRRRIREEEPPSPSARLKVLDRSAKDVQGDLDWIALRCLEKEPARRYQTASGLLLDIQRYLRHEPVEARPPSLSYVLTKFGRRNRAMVAAVVVAAVLVGALVINTSVQAQRVAAEKARVLEESQRAEKVAEFMLETLAKTEPFGYAETGQPESAAELLDRAGRWLQQGVKQNPELRARLLESVGRAYRRREQDRRAIAFLQEAVKLRRELSGGTADIATVNVAVELAVCLRNAGRYDASARLLAEGADMLHRLGLEHSLINARLLANRGRLEASLGRPGSSLTYLEQALALARELERPPGLAVAELLASKADVLTWQDELQQAEDAARAALAIYDARVHRMHPDRIYALSSLGETLRLQHKLDEASLVFRETIAAERTLYGEDSRRLASDLDSTARIAREQGRLDDAETLQRQALDAHIRGYGLQHIWTGFLRNMLGTVLIERAKFAEAEEQLRASLAVFARSLPPDHPYIGSSDYYLGEVMLATRRPKEAEAFFRAAIDITQHAQEPQWRTARSASGLGEALYRQGRADEAEDYLLAGYRVLASEPKADERPRVASRERLVRFYVERAREARNGVQLVAGESP
jgi:serine/threonine protein kinase